jgi:hypothetical protein
VVSKVQQVLKISFLPLSRYLDENDIRRLCEFSVKQSGLALPDPTKSSSNYEASTCVNTHLIAALKRTISALVHVATMREIRIEIASRKRLTTSP